MIASDTKVFLLNCLCSVSNPNLITRIASFLSGRTIAIRVDGYLFNRHSMNSGVPQGSVISPVLFILFINDALSSTSSSIFSFADETYLSSSFLSNPQHLAYSNISPHRYTSASLLPYDLTNIERWVKDNHVEFNQGRQHRLSYHPNIIKIFPLFSWMAVNCTFYLLSLSLVSLFHLNLETPHLFHC